MEKSLLEQLPKELRTTAEIIMIEQDSSLIQNVATGVTDAGPDVLDKYKVSAGDFTLACKAAFLAMTTNQPVNPELHYTEIWGWQLAVYLALPGGERLIKMESDDVKQELNKDYPNLVKWLEDLYQKRDEAYQREKESDPNLTDVMPWIEAINIVDDRSKTNG